MKIEKNKYLFCDKNIKSSEINSSPNNNKDRAEVRWQCQKQVHELKKIERLMSRSFKKNNKINLLASNSQCGNRDSEIDVFLSKNLLNHINLISLENKRVDVFVENNKIDRKNCSNYVITSIVPIFDTSPLCFLVFNDEKSFFADISVKTFIQFNESVEWIDVLKEKIYFKGYHEFVDNSKKIGFFDIDIKIDSVTVLQK